MSKNLAENSFWVIVLFGGMSSAARKVTMDLSEATRLVNLHNLPVLLLYYYNVLCYEEEDEKEDD